MDTSDRCAPSRLFDPTNKKYQRHSNFLPNKESTWPGPIEFHSLTLAHQCIRGELKLLVGAVQATLDSYSSDKKEQTVVLEDWKLRGLKRAIRIHLQNIRLHHKAEEEVYVPWLESRIILDQPKIDAAHVALLLAIKELDKATAKLQADSPKSLRSLRRKFEDYQAILVPQLKRKDEFTVPLLRAYFTPAEMKPIIRRANRATTINKNGAFIYHQGESFFRATYMKQERKPWFLWYLVYRSQLRIYEKNFVRPLENIKQDQEPEEPSSFLPAFCAIL